MGVSVLERRRIPVLGLKSRLCIDMGITVVLSTVLILQGLITVLLPFYAEKTASTKEKTNPEVLKHSLLYRDYGILSDVIEPDRQQILKIGAVYQNTKDVKRLISQCIHAAAISIAGIWILKSIGQIIMNRKFLCKSLMALSVGGHAPPKGRIHERITFLSFAG